MTLSTQPYKGMRDFYPEDMRLRTWMFNKVRQVCESYGYEEYDAPVLESLDLYLSKTSEEIVSEQSYSFTDRGDRKVIMRPEMTPSVSRMVAARRQELGYPLRLYSIANFFRYERPQKGRLREFWQLNADIFGVQGIEADIEAIQLADSILKAFGATPDMYEIRINSRNFIKQRSALAQPKNPNLTPNDLLRVLDSWSKNEDRARQEIKSMFNKPEVIFGMISYNEEENNKSIFVDELKEILSKLRNLGVSSARYDAQIARGFDYYTDIVFEIFDKNPDNNRSLFGGGRYDGLVSNFGVEPVPTVGFGMGDVTLVNFLESNNLIPELKPATDVAMILLGDVYEKAQGIAAKLRESGINVSIDYDERKIEKKIKAAVKNGLRHALFVGESELSSGQFSLKDLSTGEESKCSLEQVISKLQ